MPWWRLATSTRPMPASIIDNGLAWALRVGEAIEQLSVREIGPEALAASDPGGRLLRNVNTPDDYQRAYHTA